MNFRNGFKIKTLLIFIFLMIPIFAGAVNFNQTIRLKEDGSGSINLFYIEKSDVIKSKNNIIGNLPFSKDKFNEYFMSDKVKIFESSVKQSSKDNTMTEVLLSLTFSNMKDLSSLKGLKYEDFIYTKTDTGYVFKNSFAPEFTSVNSINQVYSVLHSDIPIGVNNGVMKDNVLTWFRSKEYFDAQNGLVFYAILKGSGTGNTTGNKTGDNSGDGKSCGLFGLELPLIVLLGSVLISQRKRFNKK